MFSDQKTVLCAGRTSVLESVGVQSVAMKRGETWEIGVIIPVLRAVAIMYGRDSWEAMWPIALVTRMSLAVWML